MSGKTSTKPDQRARKAAARPGAASGAAKPRETAARPRENGKPVLLSGGNPQIPKGHGDAPVQAYIAAMPGWKRDAGRRQCERTMPPLEQRDAERILERLDLTRQRGLREEKLVGRERERKPPTGGLETAQKVERRQAPQRFMHAFHACVPCEFRG